MADAVVVREILMTASRYLAPEVVRVYEALFRWLPSRVGTLFLAEVDMTVDQSGGQAAAAATNVLSVEINSPAGATLDTNVELYNALAVNVTLGTTIPVARLRCVATQSVVLPFFKFESSQFGQRMATAWSVANTTALSLTAQPAAADRVQCRVVTVGVA